MRKQVKDALDNLLLAVQSGESYTNYEKIRQSLVKYPDKVDKINQFREKRYFVCKEANCGFEKLEELLALEEALKKDRDCRDFLYWENEFCHEMRMISETILDMAEFDISDTKEGDHNNEFKQV